MISQNSRNLNRERGNNQLAELIHKCKENAKEHAREYLIKFFRTIDDQFFNSRLWENEFKNHGFIGRTWITSIGVIKFKRRYYVSMDKKRNKNLYFVDAYFQLPKYTRLTPDAMLALTRMATDTNASYAAKHALWDAKISKQTVSNLLRSFTPVYEDLPVLPEIIEDFNESKETIYIELDEAHCNLQNSKNIIANLGLVHTGHKTSNYASKRKELENKHYFGGVNVDTSSFSDRIYDYISKRYNNGGVKYIFVSGDGAAWIKSVHNKLKRCFSNNNIEVVQVLDRFHLRKRLTTIFSGNKKMINYFLNNVDKMTAEGFTKIAYTFYEGNPDHKCNELWFHRHVQYICKNLKIIKNQNHPNYQTSCSMEGHVSHVLAKRLTSRPKGFAKKTLEALVQLLVQKANIRELTLDDLNVWRKYQPVKQAYVRKFSVNKIYKPCYDYNVCMEVFKSANTKMKDCIKNLTSPHWFYS